MPGGNKADGTADRQRFGRRVRALREALGVSQEAMADRAGVHRTYLSSLERGQRNVSLDITLRLAEALGVEPAELFKGWD